MIASKDQTVVAFDVYGTLLSTESIVKQLASQLQCGREKAQTIAASWRKYQLEYTWRLNSMGQYQDFSTVTRGSLEHALAEASASLDEKSFDELMHAYDSLDAFEDVVPLLEALQQESSIHPVLFSNGTRKMVSTSVVQSPGLAEHSRMFKEIVVVEQVQRYKPAPEVYHYLAKEVGKDPTSKDDMASIWLVSGNPFDIVGARAQRLNAIWVNRAGGEWQDGLVSGQQGRPTVIVNSLVDVIKAIAKR